jgi:predicted DNA-binding protein
MAKERKDNFIIVRVSKALKDKMLDLSKKAGKTLSDYTRDTLEKL